MFYCPAYLYLLGATLLLLTAQSCGTPEPPAEPRILLPYVRYLAEDQSLTAQFTAFAGDSVATAEPLTFAQGVAFLGSAMRAAELPGQVVRYIASQRVPYPTDLRFSYPTDEAGNRTTIDLRMTGVSTTAIPPTLSRSRGLTFATGGGPLTANEQLLFFFEDSTGTPRQIVVAGPGRDSLVRLTGPSMVNIPVGNYELYVVKKQETSRREGATLIQSAVEYYTANQPVKVVD